MKEQSRQLDFHSALPVLSYIPNIIDYVRIGLLVVSWISYYPSAWISLISYVASMLLDAVDGMAARHWKQTSAFGAWLDVVVDNLGRGFLWCQLYSLGFFVTALEWLAFVCTHTFGSTWKSHVVGPWLIQAVMKNNFRSPVGSFVILSLNLLPVWLYCIRFELLTEIHLPLAVQYSVLLAMIVGRITCGMVEIWVISTHILLLCQENKNSSQ